MPKYYSPDRGYHGLYNNANEMYINHGNVFDAPSDWKLIIDYKMTYKQGDIKLNAKVVPFGENGSPNKELTRTYAGDVKPGTDNEAELAY